MKTKTLTIFFVTILSLLVAGFALLAARPAQAAWPALFAGQPFAEDEITGVTEVETVTTFILSNEAPGHLVDHLIALGHGDDTLFEVLSYLKSQSGGIISDEWYNQLAASLPGSEVFTARLSNYSGLVGGIEIAADGTISIPSVEGSDYYHALGYDTRHSQDWQFIFTNAKDVAHYIYTHTNEYGGGGTRDYYAFAIAWREACVYLPLVRR